LQCVTDQQGRRLIILTMHGGLATSQIVVIHAGQIIMHQRIHMNHLDGSSGALQRICRRIKHRTRREYQQGSYPLAAIQCGITHRLM